LEAQDINGPEKRREGRPDFNTERGGRRRFKSGRGGRGFKPEKSGKVNAYEGAFGGSITLAGV